MPLKTEVVEWVADSLLCIAFASEVECLYNELNKISDDEDSPNEKSLILALGNELAELRNHVRQFAKESGSAFGIDSWHFQVVALDDAFGVAGAIAWSNAPMAVLDSFRLADFKRGLQRELWTWIREHTEAPHWQAILEAAEQEAGVAFEIHGLAFGPLSGKEVAPSTSGIAGETPTGESASEGADARSEAGGRKRKRRGRRRRGESAADTKIIAALSKHHKYAPRESKGLIGNPEYAVAADLAEIAGVSEASVSRFMNRQFPEAGYKGYCAACISNGILTRLQYWNGEPLERLAPIRENE